MSTPKFWNDPDGTWFQIDAQTFGPFDSEAAAEKSADTILSVGPFDQKRWDEAGKLIGAKS